MALALASASLLAACEGNAVTVTGDPGPSQSAQATSKPEQNVESPNPTPTTTSPSAPSKAPVVEFSNSGSNVTVNVGYELGATVEATDSDGRIVDVSLYIDDREIRRESAAPYRFGRESSDGGMELEGLPVGAHTIKAVAVDDSGLRAEDKFTLTVEDGSAPEAGKPEAVDAAAGVKPATSGACTLDQPVAGMPPGMTLFTVKSVQTVREDFCSIDKWYDETANKQVFSIFPGDDFADANPGSRSHARTEASGGLNFTRAQGTWHEFEADMLVNALPPEGNDPVTLAQVFAGCCGPVLRIEITEKGQLRWGSTDDGMGYFSEGDQSYAGKPFKLKMRSNGSQVEAYMDGKLRYSGSIRRFPGDENALYHFRWGIYSNASPDRTLTNTVTNVRRS
ncbi:MAG: Ig-like domain-containing protein [Dermatophilaceae bacterium]